MCNNTYKTILLTGIPRSGTTLVCSLFHQLKNSLSLVEPINPWQAPLDNIEAIRFIQNFEFDTRLQILQEGLYPSKAKNRKIVSNFLDEQITEGDLRQSVVEDSLVMIDKKISKEFSILLKQNAFFTALLPQIQYFYEVYIVIRNPLAVLLSWNSVALPVNQGRIPAGERYDKKLQQILDNTDSKLDRQIQILEWFFQKYDKYVDQSKIIRYEELITGNSSAFKKLINNQEVDKTSFTKSREKLYRIGDVELFYNALMQTSYVKKFYSENEITKYYESLLA